jgi:pimeloyl-ACP methyl ester carboxylesterase
MNETALTAVTRFATIGGNRIAYRQLGSGSPVILINRFRGTLDTWDPLFLDLLAARHTVVTFDYPGVGYSEGSLPTTMSAVAAEVTKLADHLNFDQFSVIGFSYGSLVSQYVTFLNPARVLRNVVIGGNPPGKNDIPFEPAFLERALKPTNDFDDAVVLFFEPKSENSRRAAKASMERISKRLDASKIPATPELFQRYFDGGGTFAEDKPNFRGAYQSLKTPVLAISGDHDISFAVGNWFALVGKAPTLQLVVVPDAGHAPHHQSPELVTGYIHTFLQN